MAQSRTYRGIAHRAGGSHGHDSPGLFLLALRLADNTRHSCRRGWMAAHVGGRHGSRRTHILLHSLPNGYPARHNLPAAQAPQRILLLTATSGHTMVDSICHACGRDARHIGDHRHSRPCSSLFAYRGISKPAGNRSCGILARSGCHSVGHARSGYGCAARTRPPAVQHHMSRRHTSRRPQPVRAIPYRYRHRPLHRLRSLHGSLQGRMHRSLGPYGRRLALRDVFRLHGGMSQFGHHTAQRAPSVADTDAPERTSRGSRIRQARKLCIRYKNL